MRLRAVALIYNDKHQILLMLRRKEGRAYATLPGGGIEPGETPAEACAREVLEEVNLTVTVGAEVLVLENIGNREHYFLTRDVRGDMRLGDGPEGIRQSEQNWYEPQWVTLDRLDAVNLVPEQARGLVRESWLAAIRAEMTEFAKEHAGTEMDSNPDFERLGLESWKQLEDKEKNQ